MELGDPEKVVRMFSVDEKTKMRVEKARDKLLKKSEKGTVNATST